MKYQCVSCGKLLEQQEKTEICPHCGGKLQEKTAPQVVKPSTVAYVKYGEHQGDSQR